MTRAFTLIELSIVLIIIGLLVGGVLAGRDLIKQAELSAVVREVEAMSVARRTFELKYGGIAGDLDNASAFGLGSNGDDDGRVADRSTEIVYHWDHLANAGLIAGEYNGSYSEPVLPNQEAPGTPLGGESVFWYMYPLVSNNSWSGAAAIYGATSHFLGIGRDNDYLGGDGGLYGAALSPSDARAIDVKNDDGGASSGQIRAMRPYDDSSWLAVCLGGATAGSLLSDAAGTHDYNLDETDANCRLMFFE